MSARGHGSGRVALGRLPDVCAAAARGRTAGRFRRIRHAGGQQAVRGHHRLALRRGLRGQRVRGKLAGSQAARATDQSPHSRTHAGAGETRTGCRLREDPSYPFILSAGERRSDTSNTTIRDPGWHRKGVFGTLRISPRDATDLGCTEGDWVRLTTRRGTAQAQIEITSELQPGHVSLPNGHGIEYHLADGSVARRGVALNELTAAADRDPIAGTPWHKHVRVRIERLNVAPGLA